MPFPIRSSSESDGDCALIGRGCSPGAALWAGMVAGGGGPARNEASRGERSAACRDRRFQRVSRAPPSTPGPGRSAVVNGNSERVGNDLAPNKVSQSQELGIYTADALRSGALWSSELSTPLRLPMGLMTARLRGYSLKTPPRRDRSCFEARKSQIRNHLAQLTPPTAQLVSCRHPTLSQLASSVLWTVPNPGSDCRGGHGVYA